ncbi:cytochrome aa3 quinol oxidase subunit III [Barrientosiimonas marina]|uniref:Quinol oxidase subunit 3 n=1 Tax=Lentibacillus kimchii TaxID=1542911 RepID=A0ABW2UWN1_9BACI
MSTEKTNAKPLEHQTEKGELSIVGFWIFLAAEIALFGTLFATYTVLFGRTADAASPADMFEPGSVLVMTFILLLSSFTSGLAIHEMRRGSSKGLIIWLAITLVLGLSFLGLEVNEFIHYTQEGVTLQSAAFWSAFFVLTGTHGIHVTFGAGWGILLLIQSALQGVTATTSRKVFIFSLYWHFLDVVWIFIFTGVYLIGMVV